MKTLTPPIPRLFVAPIAFVALAGLLPASATVSNNEQSRTQIGNELVIAGTQENVTTCVQQPAALKSAVEINLNFGVTTSGSPPASVVNPTSSQDKLLPAVGATIPGLPLAIPKTVLS